MRSINPIAIVIKKTGDEYTVQTPPDATLPLNTELYTAADLEAARKDERLKIAQEVREMSNDPQLQQLFKGIL